MDKKEIEQIVDEILKRKLKEGFKVGDHSVYLRPTYIDMSGGDVRNVSGGITTGGGTLNLANGAIINAGSIDVTGNIECTGYVAVNDTLWMNGGTIQMQSGSIQDILGGMNACSFVISKAGSTYYAKNGMTGLIDYSGSNCADVVQECVDILTSGGYIFFTKGEFEFTKSVILDSYIMVSGCGYGTTFKPTADISIFKVVGPATRIILKDMQMYDSASNTAYSPAIYLDPSLGVISLSKFQNIVTYDYAGGIYTPDTLSSDINYSILSCYFDTILANDHTYNGFIFYSFYDCRFNNMLATQGSSLAVESFRFQNASDSGSMFNGITALGKADTSGSGIAFNAVSNLYGTNFISDTYNEGLHFIGTCDDICLSNVECRASANDGIYGYHSSGRITITGFIGLSNTNYGVLNANQGGNITVLGGKLASNGTPYGLVSGDKLAYVDGGTAYGSA